MKNKTYNPAAFPLKHSDNKFNPGMTLRDYFAGQIITGILSNPKFGDGDAMLHEYVEYAYDLSDELLIKRQYDESEDN